MIEIKEYFGKHDKEIIDLILTIQNEEAKIGLSLEEQPDLKNIHEAYQLHGGQFWLALDGERVVGTIGLMDKGENCAVLKKFFVNSEYRSQKVGLKLYQALLQFAEEKGFRHIILDTPSVATVAHRFYERSGFKLITKEELPVEYTYPDRDCLLYMLTL